MPNDKDPEVKPQDSKEQQQPAGYPARGSTSLDQRATTSKLSRHTTRILPTPIALRAEYTKLANNPKCGKRGAISVLARKYKVSQSAVRKALEKKQKRA